MTTKVKYTLLCITLVTAFAFGRYSSPVKTETKIVEVEKQVEDKTADTDKHQDTKTTTTKNKDGSETTTTEVVVDTKKHVQDDIVIKKDKSTDTVTTYSEAKMTLSALGGISASFPPKPIYGGSVSKPLFGPICAGAWGISSGEIGISIGLQF